MTRLVGAAVLLASGVVLADQTARSAPAPAGPVAWSVVVTGPNAAQQTYEPSKNRDIVIAGLPAPWACIATKINAQGGGNSSFEAVRLVCTAGEAEVSKAVVCWHRSKPAHPAGPERMWKPTERGDFTVAAKGDRLGFVLSLLCMVDTRFTTD